MSLGTGPKRFLLISVELRHPSCSHCLNEAESALCCSQNCLQDWARESNIWQCKSRGNIFHRIVLLNIQTSCPVSMYYRYQWRVELEVWREFWLITSFYLLGKMVVILIIWTSPLNIPFYTLELKRDVHQLDFLIVLVIWQKNLIYPMASSESLYFTC